MNFRPKRGKSCANKEYHSKPPQQTRLEKAGVKEKDTRTKRHFVIPFPSFTIGAVILFIQNDDSQILLFYSRQKYRHE